MKLIIAGSRDLIVSQKFLQEALGFFKLYLNEIVSGMASSGIDQCGLKYAKINSISVKEFPADWGS